MTAVVVVDASALGALLFGEPEQDAVADRLRGAELHAPVLVTFEVANIAVKKVGRRELGREAALDALAALSALDIILDDVTANDCADIALAAGLTAYDAAYLLLARQLVAPLVTLDEKLQKAARTARV